MKTVLQIYREHEGKVSDRWHLYLAEYDRLFAPYREKPVRLLEIGVQNGGSLDIWGKVFPHARKIVGCDVDPDCSRLQYDDPRIALVIGDALSDEVRQRVLKHSPAFELIIDDGSHRSGDIICAFARYFPSLEEDGLYLVEDLHCSYWQEYSGGLYHPDSAVAFFKRLVDVINREHWGIDRTRTEFLRAFEARYRAPLHEGMLRQIHSIEFLNSLCVIRKRTAPRNALGPRIVVGTVESVQPSPPSLDGTGCDAPDQHRNPWAVDAESRAEELLRSEMLARERELERAQAESTDRAQRIEALEREVLARSDELERMRADISARHAELQRALADMKELRHEVSNRDRQIGRLQSEVSSREGKLRRANAEMRRLKDELGVRDRKIGRLQSQAATQEGDLQRLVADATRREAELAERSKELAKVRSEITAIRGSTSWRLTGPARRLASRFKWRGHVALVLKVPYWLLTFQLLRRLRERSAARIIARSGLFDAEWYLANNPDIAASCADPALHYVIFGAKEGRDPSPGFDTSYYLETCPDAARSGTNPLLHYLLFGRAEGRSALAAMPAPDTASQPEPDYDAWVRRHDTLAEADVAAIRSHLATLRERPLISVVMPVYDPPLPFLRDAIDSVLAQIYPDWELCIADDGSPDPGIRTMLQDYARRERRIKLVLRERRGHISAASNSALELATGKFVALMDHDDRLPPHALYMAAVEVNAHPDADLIYSDEDKIDAEGRRHDPYFKPDWNPALFLCQNFVSHLGLYRTSLVRAAGGFREGFEGSQDYDLALRISTLTSPQLIRHIPYILYHWRISPGVQTFSTGHLPVTVQAARRAIAEHLERTGDGGEVVPSELPLYSRIKRPLADPAPRVALIVPTRDKLELLRICVDGLRRTSYPNLEIIVVDNDSREAATLDYLRELDGRERMRVLRIEGDFNFSELNNRAVEVADAEIVGFINNDVEVIEPGWLGEMVSQIAQPGVGAVGAKLYYGDDTIQHAGVVVGMGGVAGHAYKALPRSSAGYFGQLKLVRDVSCVTAACMIVRKDVFSAVGGFDEVNLKVAFNDVDLCLKIRQAGHRIVWTPDAELYHLESVSRGSDFTQQTRERFAREVAYMERRWGDALLQDPFFNPNLSLTGTDISLAFPPRVAKPWTTMLNGMAPPSDPRPVYPRMN